jgi:hypothetical protein
MDTSLIGIEQGWHSHKFQNCRLDFTSSLYHKDSVNCSVLLSAVVGTSVDTQSVDTSYRTQDLTVL